MKAIWNNLVLAESNETIKIEKDHYFPSTSVKMEHLKKSNKIGKCMVKGDACYYDVVANGKVNKDAASSYSYPSEAAAQIKDYIVFGEGVEIKE